MCPDLTSFSLDCVGALPLFLFFRPTGLTAGRWGFEFGRPVERSQVSRARFAAAAVGGGGEMSSRLVPSSRGVSSRLSRLDRPIRSRFVPSRLVLSCFVPSRPVSFRAVTHRPVLSRPVSCVPSGLSRLL